MEHERRNTFARRKYDFVTGGRILIDPGKMFVAAGSRSGSIRCWREDEIHSEMRQAFPRGGGSLVPVGKIAHRWDFCIY